MALPDCTEAELQAIYEWVDSVPLSRPKRNIARDFADGVLMAELVHHYFPRLVELHNYSPAHNSVQKAYNWATLNQKVFKRLGLTLSRDQCNAVANADGGAIERTLKAVRAGMARFQEGAVARSGSGGSPSHAAASTSQPVSPAYAHGGYPAAGGAEAAADSIAALRIAADVPAKYAQQGMGGGAVGSAAASKAAAAAAAAAGYPTLDHAVAASLEAKECQLEELRETNEILETKISKLEQLVRLKDAKIQALLARLQAPAMQGGGIGGEGIAL